MILFLSLFITCLFSVFLIYAILGKKLQYWILSDIKRSVINFFLSKPEGNTHIMFAFVDHFEPGNGNAPAEQQTIRVSNWVERYPELAKKHKDSDGVNPQHTFFFPPHYNTHDHLQRIVNLCSRGFGEVEMHLHHDRQAPWPDDVSSLNKKILDCIESYSIYGIFCLPNGRKAYGFIHGDWALCNSLKGGLHCGVNDELSVLEETGCYADFTFPICNEAQAKLSNTFFYAQSYPNVPKGYNKSADPVKKGKPRGKGLMLIQGVLGLRWKSRTNKIKPSIEQSNVDVSNFPFERRIDYWINKRVHVQGKKNWIFVKISTHGAKEETSEILLGKKCDEMYEYLESKYNDGKRYFLHYVSAREMYNIIKAAEAGKNENPHEYRNYIIPRYLYLPNRHL
jgi:hypothetical protein